MNPITDPDSLAGGAALDTCAEALFFKPLLVERVWGGNKLGPLFGRKMPWDKIIGESWELSDRPEAQSIVDGGRFGGRTLREIIQRFPRDILGAMPDAGRFPLLFKYVDAGAALSVQVHPDDAGALPFRDLGKNECWLVVRAEPGAKVIRGFKAGTTREDFERAVASGRAGDALHEFEPKAGDVIALPAGTVHAIGAGLVVAEVQQNSDVTFRIFDYNRKGLDGKPRQLHVAEAFGSIRFGKASGAFTGDMTRDTVEPVLLSDENGVRQEKFLDGDFFAMERWTIQSGRQALLPRNPVVPRVLMFVEGVGRLETRPVSAGVTALIPAAAAELKIVAQSNMTVLMTAPR